MVELPQPHAPEQPRATKRRERRPSAVHATPEELQRDIDALQDKLLMDKLHPEEERRLTKLIALRRSHNQERPETEEERKNDRVEMHKIMARLGPKPTMPPNPEMEAIPVLIDEPEATSERPDLGVGDRQRVRSRLTEEEREVITNERLERSLATRRKALSDAQGKEAELAERIEQTYGSHPAALEIQRGTVRSRFGRWFRGGLHRLMGETSPDEEVQRDLAAWRAASERVESLREALGEMDMTGVGLAKVEGKRMRADMMRKRQAEGDREAAARYRMEHDLMAPGGDLESQERSFFDDARSMEDVVDAEAYRHAHTTDIERARQLFAEYAGNIPHGRKEVNDHREYAAVIWNEVENKLRKRSAATQEKAARLMGTRDVATAYMLDLAKLAEAAIEEAQDTREQITDLAESVERTRTLTEAGERVRALNRMLGWSEEKNIRPGAKLSGGRRKLKQVA